MRKIRALNNDKCLWVTRELFNRLKTLKVLGINTFEAEGCDICHMAITAYLDYGRDRLRVEHHGGKQWAFTIGNSWEYNGSESAIIAGRQLGKAGWNKP